MKVKGKEVNGILLDQESRCKHYQQASDVVAIKMYCCKEFYACLECHKEVADHEIKVWPSHAFDHHAILCGSCGNEISIQRYLNSSQCPACLHAFNPNCSIHYDQYFDLFS